MSQMYYKPPCYNKKNKNFKVNKKAKVTNGRINKLVITPPKKKKVLKFDKDVNTKIWHLVALISPESFVLSERYKRGLLVYLDDRRFSLPNRTFSAELAKHLVNYVLMMRRKYFNNKLTNKYGSLNNNNNDQNQNEENDDFSFDEETIDAVIDENNNDESINESNSDYYFSDNDDEDIIDENNDDLSFDLNKVKITKKQNNNDKITTELNKYI